jgi:hypothetical protein
MDHRAFGLFLLSCLPHTVSVETPVRKRNKFREYGQFEHVSNVPGFHHSSFALPGRSGEIERTNRIWLRVGYERKALSSFWLGRFGQGSSHLTTWRGTRMPARWTFWSVVKGIGRAALAGCRRSIGCPAPRSCRTTIQARRSQWNRRMNGATRSLISVRLRYRSTHPTLLRKFSGVRAIAARNTHPLGLPGGKRVGSTLVPCSLRHARFEHHLEPQSLWPFDQVTAKTLRFHTALQQVRNPLAVFDVALAAGHLLQLARVYQQQHKTLFQQVLHRLPQYSSGFHGDVGHALCCQPLRHPQYVSGHRPKGLNLFADITLRADAANCHPEQTLNQVRFFSENGFEDSAIKIVGEHQCAQRLLEGGSRVVESCRRRTIDRAIGFLDPVVH